MTQIETIKHSPFYNTYGGLSLIKAADGKFYLRMEDCFCPDIFGPLTEDQVNAFNALCDVKEAML